MAAIIFDMDGVLVSSGAAHAKSWQLAAKKYDREVDQKTFTATFGRPSRDIIRLIWGAETTDDQVTEIDALKETLYRELITGMVPLMVGVREVLAAFAEEGYQLAVGSSGPKENIDLVLDETGLRSQFSAVVNGFDIEHGKPAPDCFLLCAERMGVNPETCLVIEDAPVGIQAANAAGMKAVGLTGTHPAEPLHNAGAAEVVEDLRHVTPELAARLGIEAD
jgi:beta-phosphoglucomutase